MKKILLAAFFILIVFQLLAQCPKNFFNVVRNSDTDSVKYYLGLGYDINCKDDYGNTILMSVAGSYWKVDIKMLDFLLERGADINAMNKSKENLLNVIINNMNDSNAFAYVLKKGIKYDVCYIKEPPLYQIIGSYAVENQLGFIRALGDIGYDINAKCDKTVSPMYYALQRGKPDIALHLINKGAYIDDRSLAENLSQSGITSGYKDQDYFIRQQRAVNDTLINNAIGLNSKGGNFNACPLTYTIMYGYKNYFDKLMSKNIDITITDEHGWTPLHEASYKDPINKDGNAIKLYFIKALIEKGADVNALSKGERYYSGFGFEDIVVEPGSTPLDAAIESQASYEIIEFLRSKGGKQVKSGISNQNQ
jgi:ankyrin repeat protein